MHDSSRPVESAFPFSDIFHLAPTAPKTRLGRHLLEVRAWFPPPRCMSRPCV
jgi:hypothetical protein